MKKACLWGIILAFSLCLSACGEAAESAGAEAEISETATPEQQTSEPEVPPDRVIKGSDIVFQEFVDDMKANNGENVGAGMNNKECTDDGIVFSAGEGENPFIDFSILTDEPEGVMPGANQAVFVSFCPSASDFGFMLTSTSSIGITIGEEGEPCLFALDAEIMTPLDTDLRVEPGKLYHILMAIDTEGNFQGALWKEEAPSDAAYFDIALGALENGGQYKNNSWKLSVGFKGPSTFTISDYCYLTFGSFVSKASLPEIPVETPDLNADPMNVVSTVLNDPQIIGGEGTEAMTDNMGGMFGGIDIKQPAEDGGFFQFISEDNNAWMPYNTRLLDVGKSRNNTQAFMIKFQPTDLNNLSFNFIGMGEVAVNFADDNMPKFVNVQEAFMTPFSDFAPTDLTLSPENWYYALFAFDSDGNFRSVIWEDGKAEERAYFEERLGEQRDDYRESNWKVVIGFDAGGTLNVERYDIMDFEDFSDVQTSDGQNGDNIPTLTDLGFDYGNYQNDEDGISINIQSIAEVGAQQDTIHFGITLYDNEFGVNILYPEKIYQIFIDDELWYNYDPANYEIVDPWFDVDVALANITGKSAVDSSEEIITVFDGYCLEKFGFTPEALILMPY